MLLGGIAVPDYPFKKKAVGGSDCDGFSGAHAPDSHRHPAMRTPKRSLQLGSDH